MAPKRRTPGYGIILPIALLGFAGYFVFAAVQGEYGVFRRVELEADRARLEGELALLTQETDRMRDQTRRLSDDYLDLDLLDERARIVLGMARVDEIVIE
ncbi:septum formation initiator [Jannaschia pagri]|uniref:Septum formation initiator n=1 Tax=Jannaschia pagri TaxID=2829797 RepID=A0ABQ4NMP0_9RHOB|nr:MULTISPECIES: septum formation initiator family protein [unclassified Jannaschia]GIT91832.1 septum formation initiator [Jannaschia sp. AI_61]GIT95666.1 septum formation initiator [Jannaschia sp. AI_62]